MDAELKTEWIKALRSGEYRQTRGTLKDEFGGYCCLGVLCEVAGLEINGEGTGVKTEGHKVNYEPIYALVGGMDISHSCSMRNDGSDKPGERLHRHSFAEIASYIEANL